jgi:hypothetical protein
MEKAAVQKGRKASDPLEITAPFADLFSNLTEQSVGEKIAGVYSQDAYLNDTLKEHTGLTAIRDYLIQTARAVKLCRVKIVDAAVSGEDIYIRWTMDVQFNNLNRGKLSRSSGMSHLRLDSDGLIKFHQDYWDSTSGFFQYVPIVGTLIRWIKRRL